MSTSVPGQSHTHFLPAQSQEWEKTPWDSWAHNGVPGSLAEISCRGNGRVRQRRGHSHLPLLGDSMEDTYPKLAVAKKEWGGHVLGTRERRSLTGKATLKIQERTEDVRGHSGDDDALNALCGRLLGDANPGHPRLKLNRNRENTAAPSGSVWVPMGLLKMINR